MTKRKERREEEAPVPKPIAEHGLPDPLLHPFSDAQLQQELHRRKEEREAAQQQIIFELQRRQAAAMTKGVADAFAPKHGRTSCSDANLANGWSYDNFPRCNRCALLQLANGASIDGNFLLRLEIVKPGGLEEL